MAIERQLPTFFAIGTPNRAFDVQTRRSHAAARTRPLPTAKPSTAATVTTGIDFQLSGSNNQRPNPILTNPLCDDPRPSCWINPAAFAQPALGTLGNSGRSSIPGPGFWEIDTALSRIFRVREGRTVELRAEAFNLTNSFRAGSPGMPTVTTARNSPQFGQILTAQDPRIMQLAMKFVF